MTKVKIYHNPKCGTSRKTLALLHEAGVVPEVIEYLKTPLNHEDLVSLLCKLAVSARQLVRVKGNLYKELGLSDVSLTEDALIDALVDHPVLMERPVVVTAKGARICRPCELVQALL